MVGNSKLTAILCGMFGGLCVVAGSNVTHAQALRPSVQEPSGSPQSSPLPGTSPAHPPQEQTAPVYPQTSDGFSAQFDAAVEAYQKGDAIAGRSLLEQFRLLRSAEWLAEFVGPEQSETLAKRYDREFENYLKFTEARLASAKGRKVNINFKPGMGTQGLPNAATLAGPLKLSGIVALKEPVCFSAYFGARLTGKTDLVLKGNFKSVSWEDTFVYQDGAFRFIGGGAWPFWVWEDRSEGKAP